MLLNFFVCSFMTVDDVKNADIKKSAAMNGVKNIAENDDKKGGATKNGSTKIVKHDAKKDGDDQNAMM